MALKIDRQGSSLSSLEEMRVQVIFQLSSGAIINGNGSEGFLVADSISDLPSTGDYVVLSEGNGSEATPIKNSYKIISRSIDYSNFTEDDGRIICTLRAEIATV